MSGAGRPSGGCPSATVTDQDRPRWARFAAAVVANGGGCHGPHPPATAADLAARLAVAHSAGRPVAMAGADAVVALLGVPARVEALGARVLLPEDDDWGTGIAAAGVGVTGAVRAAAATGTVAVACGPGSPRTTSLLPRAHVCVLAVNDVMEDLSLALASLPSLPSGLVWISGPSRSADLGMQITLGVHGPAAFDVVLVAVDEKPPAGV